MHVNHKRNDGLFIIPLMEERPDKPRTAAETLWANIVALMVSRWGKENLNQLAREAGIGTATAARLKSKATNTRVGTIEAIARKAFKIEPWQLLVPGLDPDRLPGVPKKPSREDLEAVQRLVQAHHAVTPEQRALFLQETEEGQSLMEHYPATKMDASKWSAKDKAVSELRPEPPERNPRQRRLL